MASLAVAGHELLVPLDEGDGSAMGWGCFPMVPFAGRIRNGRFRFDRHEHALAPNLGAHAIHGTCFDRAWTSTGPGRAAIDLGDDWPFAGTASQEVTLEPGRLDLTLTIAADVDQPVTAGWHPWFRRTVGGADAVIHNPAEARWQRDHHGIPDGTLVDPGPGPWDDAFCGLLGPAGISWPGVVDVFVESDADTVVIYDEPDHAVCIEPQSAPPDAHNSGEDLTVIPAGSTWSTTAALLWRFP